MKLNEVCLIMEQYAPLDLAEEWDNVGLMIGSPDKNIEKILIALDASEQVVDEAIENDADLIITHHPLIFKPIRSVVESDPLGRKIIKLIQNNIAVYSSHTNLDMTDGGTNDALFELLMLTNKESMSEISPGSPGRIGYVDQKLRFIEFAEFVKKQLSLPNMTITGDRERIIKKVGLCTGAGGNEKYIQKAVQKCCDAYITGDIGYHTAQYAQDLNICLIDATHYATEIIVVSKLCDYLKGEGLHCIESKTDGQTLKII